VETRDPLFYDENSTVVANVNSANLGECSKLGLTAPDSNEVVPFGGPRFAGDFMLTSQGDLEQIYLSHAGGPPPASDGSVATPGTRDESAKVASCGNQL